MKRMAKLSFMFSCCMTSSFNIRLSQYHNSYALIDVYSPAEISLSMVLNPSNYSENMTANRMFILGILSEHFKK